MPYTGWNPWTWGGQPEGTALPDWMKQGNPYWSQAAWANVPRDQAQMQQAWMNVMLPYMQAQMQGQQWGEEFDWRKLQDEWNKQFQEQQFGWQKEQDVWGREQAEKQRAAEAENVAMQAFGRRWAPQTRWA